MTQNSNGSYKVTGPHGTHAKGTTKKKAEAQVRLLNAIDHGWKPTGGEPPMSKKSEIAPTKENHAKSHGEFMVKIAKKNGMI